ncbi:MAG: phosphoadenosine phosphosulfate reductase family protein [Promethearchaeota archaeon]
MLRGRRCPSCGKPTVACPMTPPGDARPAFEFDLNLLWETIDRDFEAGAGKFLFPEGRAVLFNKVGDVDENHEVWAQGERQGNLRFDPRAGRHQFLPAKAGAEAIYKFYHDSGRLDSTQEVPRKCVLYSDDGAPHVAAGRSVLVPGVVAMDLDVRKGDPCLVYCSAGFLGTGRFLADGDELRAALNRGRGQLAKLKFQGPPKAAESIPDPSGHPAASWQDVARVNAPLVEEDVRRAVEFVRKTRREHADLPVGVAFSGGKDSLVTLLVVLEALGGGAKMGVWTKEDARDETGTGNETVLHVFFVDTGLEFPEVVENVRRVVHWAGLEATYHERSAGDDFWRLAESFGPPARDFRFCCHALKATHVNDLVAEIGEGQRVLVFLGQRRYESFQRAAEKMVYTNSFVPNQLAATPIRDWTALGEWLYLFLMREQDPTLPVNPLYQRGHERLGCYLCPAQTLASLERVAGTHPELHARWKEFLERWRADSGLPVEWLEWGLWRFKRPRGQWADLAREVRRRAPVAPSEASPNRLEKPTLTLTKGYSPCVSGGYSTKAAFRPPPSLSFCWQLFRTVGPEAEYDEELGVVACQRGDWRFTAFADGSVHVQSSDPEFDAAKLLDAIWEVLVRGSTCQACGVCERVCPAGATRLKLDEEGRPCFRVDASLCRGWRCNVCSRHCPAVQAAGSSRAGSGEGT